jgi:hypothetical protein
VKLHKTSGKQQEARSYRQKFLPRFVKFTIVQSKNRRFVVKLHKTSGKQQEARSYMQKFLPHFVKFTIVQSKNSRFVVKLHKTSGKQQEARSYRQKFLPPLRQIHDCLMQKQPLCCEIAQNMH